MTPTRLDEIGTAADGETYPRHVLDGCKTALVLFAAAFHGRQDARWVAEAGMRAVCVDLDGMRLDEMARVYPPGWSFITGDVYKYAEHTSLRSDVVSLDPHTGAMERCAELLPLWCSLARRAVILGTRRVQIVAPPDGWEATEIRPRSNFRGGVYWSVFQPITT